MELSLVRRPTEAKLRRLEALATLPVFFGLTGKRVVVAGGSEAAAWKAELLAAAGASVDIYAPTPSQEMAALVERGAAAGSLRTHARPWDMNCLSGAVLALCDASTEGEAHAFACAGRAAGVPVNVIDKPAYCAFQFGSIVNRSPVVVGISTGGAAPILGQAIRRRIETLLPPALAAWGALAASIRTRATSLLRPGRERREFWERLAQRALTGAAPSPDEGERLLVAQVRTDAGKVTLVGAGPGDAGLLTLNAVRALQSCDVILFDDLVADDVLELARREAKRIAVGKRGARQSCRQDDITALMIDLAKAGRHVVRLKSGDPSIFGRAGEEIAALTHEGIEVAVVPGVTSASAMAARLGVSLTHRDHAQVLTLLTGHSQHGRLPDTLDVQSLLGEGRTAVFYMGARTCREWVSRALAGGVAPTTPAVAAVSISRADEALWRGTLRSLPDIVANLGEGPILIGVGDAFREATAFQCGQGRDGTSTTAFRSVDVLADMSA